MTTLSSPRRAFLFPGQGSQKVGMGQAWAEAYPVACATFAEADDALGFALSKLCFEGPADELTLTANTQPAMLTMSIAVHRVLAEMGFGAQVMAGHSLGEWTALCAAGVLKLPDAVRLVRLRGQAMQAAVPVGLGAMAAVMGLDGAQVAAVCTQASRPESVVEPANFNGGQVVVSGHADAVERAMPELKAAGAKRVIKLEVSAPFHCRLMQPAALAVADALAEITFQAPAVPIVCNVTARATSDVVELKANLVKQVTGTVRWEESVQALAAMGVAQCYEVGPGNVLRGLVRRIAESMPCESVADVADLDQIKQQEIS